MKVYTPYTSGASIIYAMHMGMCYYFSVILHRFKLIRVPWFPDNVVKGEEYYSCYKWYDCQVFIGVTTEKRVAVKVQEFADHPVTIGGDPGSNGKIMAKLTHVLPGAPGDNDGDDQGREYHCNPKRPPYHAPGNVLEQPEYNVQVFHFAVLQWNGVLTFFFHKPICIGFQYKKCLFNCHT